MRTQSGTPNSIRSNRRGESMVVVMALLLVFAVLGTAILTAASSTTAASSAKAANRQAEVYATSVLTALDASVRSEESGLGAALANQLLRELLDSGQDSFSIPSGTDVAPTVAIASAGGTDLLPGLSVENVAVTYSGTATALLKSEQNEILEAHILLDSVRLTFSVQFAGQARQMAAAYSFSGYARRISADDDWIRSGTWSIQSVQ